VALMQARATRPVRTFSLGFHDAALNEAEHAKKVAAHLGTDHKELYVSPDEAMRVIPDLPTIYDEPFADSSQIPTFLVSRLARSDVTVALSGDGGDESFGGYNRYFLSRSVARTMALPKFSRALAARAITSIPPEFLDRVLARFGLLMNGRRAIGLSGDRLHKLASILDAPNQEMMYHRLISHWQDPALIVLDSRAPTTVLSSSDGRASRFRQFEHLMMYIDTLTYLPDDILVKVDRASMAVSLEARCPLLDHRVVEFAWRLPFAMKVRNGEGKWILRHLLERYVPRDLFERPKAGFGIPLGDWLRGPLRPWAEELLNETRLRRESHLEPAPIRRKWEEHLSGQRNWSYHIWDVLMFQSWLGQQTSFATEGL